MRCQRCQQTHNCTQCHCADEDVPTYSVADKSLPSGQETPNPDRNAEWTDKKISPEWSPMCPEPNRLKGELISNNEASDSICC
jgi:hypothetical protein